MSIWQDLKQLCWHGGKCPVCGKGVSDDLLCPDCRNMLNGLFSCHSCGNFIALNRYDEHTCAKPADADALLACFPYTAALKTRLRGLKYFNKPQTAGSFGNLLAAKWRDFAVDITIAEAIVPVPLHPARFAERGYNQSELLANALRRELHLPVYAHAVIRTKNTSAQYALSPTQRAENLQDAFAGGRDLPKVRGKSIILLDDIITTGATMRGCASVLRQNGATAVYGLAVGGHLIK